MKDAKGHGSNAKPIAGSPMHGKSNDELRFIMRDATEAGHNAQGMGDERGINKYADQVNDAATVLGYRSRGGPSDHPADVASRAAVMNASSKSDPVPTHDAMNYGNTGMVNLNAAFKQRAADFHAHMDDENYAGAGPAPKHWSK